MKNNWKEVRLGDICELNYGKSLVASKRVQGDIPVFASAGIVGWHNIPISTDPGIIIGRKGSVGTVYYSSKPYYCIDTAYYIKPSQNYHLKFLYYLLKNLKLDKLNSDSAVPGLNRDNAYSQTFYLPPLDEQRKIAGVLSVLDDKIELNNKINRNLEAQAQAIFKSWFIDFEPFKNGKFIDSELGKIPEGWSVGSFSEVSDLLGGGTPKATNNKFWNGTIPFFTPKDAIDIFVIETDRLITKEGLENCNTKLYPKGIIFITARGTVGKISLSGIEMAMNQSCYAIIPKHNIPTLFLYYQTVLLVKKLKNKASGAVFDAITTRDFDEAIIIPPLSIMNKFSETIENIFGAILNNIIQAKVLSKARDTLLPKLISGEMLVLDSNL